MSPGSSACSVLRPVRGAEPAPVLDVLHSPPLHHEVRSGVTRSTACGDPKRPRAVACRSPLVRRSRYDPHHRSNFSRTPSLLAPLRAHLPQSPVPQAVGGKDMFEACWTRIRSTAGPSVLRRQMPRVCHCSCVSCFACCGSGIMMFPSPFRRDWITSIQQYVPAICLSPHSPDAWYSVVPSSWSEKLSWQAWRSMLETE